MKADSKNGGNGRIFVVGFHLLDLGDTLAAERLVDMTDIFSADIALGQTVADKLNIV